VTFELLRSRNGRALVESHRGSQCGEPENSWPAIELAYRAGADLIEVDVQRARDGSLFLHHHYRLDDGRLARELDARELGDLVRLDELLRWAARAGQALSLDVKDGLGAGPGVFDAVVDAVREAGIVDGVLVLGWNHPALRRAKEREPRLRTRALLRGRPVDLADVAAAASADCLSLSYDVASAADVELLHAHGVAVCLAELWEPSLAVVDALGVDIVSVGDPRVLAKDGPIGP